MRSRSAAEAAVLMHPSPLQQATDLTNCSSSTSTILSATFSPDLFDAVLASGGSNSLVQSTNLEALLGPRRQDLVKVVPVTIIYALIFVTGLVGNVSTCVVIARNRYMHTATNYCLFNLAVSDLLMLVLGLPQETYSFWSAYPWIFGETFCIFRYT